jgi:ubiquinone/menaquinone biosynthesis C-methylase UbiE
LAKYDSIGIAYNTTRIADPYLFGRMEALLQPNKTGTYLDLGCGTGNYTLAFAKKGYKFIGIDPSERMLQTAKSRSDSVQWIKGSANQLPVNKNAFDGALATFTIHHWENLSLSFEEIQRVLQPEAQLLLLTSTPEQMEGYWLNHYFPKMMADSIHQMPSLENILAATQHLKLKVTGTEKYFVHPTLKDHFLYVGKQRPHLYLNTAVRNGISSFSNLANKEEVKSGLKKLSKDLDSGKIKDVMKEYENELGDYLYVSLKNEKSRHQ